MKSGWDRCGRSKRERGIAQLAEHRSPKPKVGGSIPSAPAPEHFSVVCSVSLRARSLALSLNDLKTIQSMGNPSSSGAVHTTGGKAMLVLAALLALLGIFGFYTLSSQGAL